MDQEKSPVVDERDYQGEIIEHIRSGISDNELMEVLEDYHEKDIAEAFENITPEERKRLYSVLGSEKISDVFSFVEDAEKYIKELGLKSAAKIIGEMDSDDAVDVLEDLDINMQKDISKLMDSDVVDDIEMIKSYDEDMIGSKMTTNYIVINKNMSVRQAMKALVIQAEKNDNISTLYVCDEHNKYYGALDLKDLITARDYMNLQDFIITSFPFVKGSERIEDCIEELKDYEEDSIPVLSDDNEIIGIITAQDLVEVVDEEFGEDYARLAGLTAEEDLNETLGQSIKKRIPWLIILLFLGLLVSCVVGMFENVVAEIALIVSFQSLILDMAGNVGTQSLAVTIRVLMDENVSSKNKASLVFKEVRVGLINGIILGGIGFLIVSIFVAVSRHEPAAYSCAVAGCVAIALLLAMVISSFVGTVIPIIFHKFKIDPAVASGPLITTINDLVGVMTYYGLAWVFLLNVMHIAG